MHHLARLGEDDKRPEQLLRNPMKYKCQPWQAIYGLTRLPEWQLYRTPNHPSPLCHGAHNKGRCHDGKHHLVCGIQRCWDGGVQFGVWCCTYILPEPIRSRVPNKPRRPSVIAKSQGEPAAGSTGRPSSTNMHWFVSQKHSVSSTEASVVCVLEQHNGTGP
jgi:hypothetical protein